MQITGTENGPYLIETGGRVTIDGETKEMRRMALCRCGASDNKPFCSGAHNKVGFEAPPVVIEIEG